MKLHSKNIGILSLIGLFLVSAIFCCCLINLKPAEAKESVPACHQTAEDAHTTSDSSEECDCEDSIATLKDGAAIKNIIHHITTLGAYQPNNNHIAVLAKVDAYQAPPLIYDTLPLYLKHAILRI